MEPEIEKKKFSEKEKNYFGKLRIIKKNLVHVQGLPKIIAKIDILVSNEYFGQYGTIEKIVISFKKNPENHKKMYSAYITYSNEREAAYAILCVDSLLFNGKIIRAFFGTTKYCSNFLNNGKCPNSDKCFFLHKIVNDNDIVIDDSINFPYNEHIYLSKIIINYFDPETKEMILKKEKPKKNVFPFLDFIFLDEEEKENYFNSGNIYYIRNKPKEIERKDCEINNIQKSKEDLKIINNNVNNFQICNTPKNIIFYMNTINNNFYINPISYSYSDNSISFIKNNIDSSKNPFEAEDFSNLINNSLSHILSAKPFYSNIKNYPLKRFELEFLKKNLANKGQDFYQLFDGCLDCLNDIV